MGKYLAPQGETPAKRHAESSRPTSWPKPAPSSGPFAGAPPQVGRATARTSVFAEQKPWRRHGFAVSSILIAQGAPSGLLANRWGQGPGMRAELCPPRWMVSGWPRPSPRGNFCFWVSDFAAWGRAFSNRPQSRAASYFAHVPIYNASATVNKKSDSKRKSQ